MTRAVLRFRKKFIRGRLLVGYVMVVRLIGYPQSDQDALKTVKFKLSRVVAAK